MDIQYREYSMQNEYTFGCILFKNFIYLQSYLKALNLPTLSFRQRITYKILILTFKAYHKTVPQYICDLIIARTYNRAVRSNKSFALVVPMIKLKHYGEQSFSYAAPVEWNKLDVEIRSLSNLETFKKKVKTYLFNIAFT